MSADNLLRLPTSGTGPPAGDVRPRALHAELPAGLRAAADRLARLVAADRSRDAEPEPSWCEGLDLEAGWQVGADVRRRLPAEAAAEAHARLDAELMRFTLDDREALIRHHRSLLVDVSHDLRSPLNSILFLADAIQSERSGALLPQQRRQISVVYTAAVTLVRLVNDLIDYARLGGGAGIEVARVSFSVESVVADVESLLGPLVAHRRVRLESRIDVTGPSWGDPNVLNRVLLNLVSNAVDAVDEGGRVTVEIREEGSGLALRVTDDRLGTDIEELRRRIAPPSGEFRNVARGWTRGLGLAICARLVSAAGGELTVESRPGEGTSFRVGLPFAAV